MPEEEPYSILFKINFSRRNLFKGSLMGAVIAASGGSLEFLAGGCKETRDDSPEGRLISVGKKVSGQEYADDVLKGDIVVRQHLSIEQSTGTAFLVHDVHGKINRFGNSVGYDEYILDGLDDIEHRAIGQYLEELSAVRDLPVDFEDRVYTVFFGPEPGKQTGLPINLRIGIPKRYSEPPLQEYFEAARYWTGMPDIYSVDGSNAILIGVSPIPDDAFHTEMPKYGVSGSVTRELIIDVTHPKNRQRLEEIAAER